MDVSLCLVTRNDGEALRDCLDSLRKATTQIEYEVIIADGGSVDGTVEMLAEDYLEVKVIRLRTPQAYSRLMNLALRSGSGDYLMTLSPRSVVHRDMLENLLAFIDVYPSAGICTPKLLNQQGKLFQNSRRSAGQPAEVLSDLVGLGKLFPNHETLGRRYLTFLPGDEICEVEAVAREAMLIRREVIDEVGYLDEGYTAEEVESDYCFRARAAGWEIYYVPDASMVEVGVAGPVSAQEWQERGEAFLRYYDRHIAPLNEAWLNQLVHWGINAQTWVRAKTAPKLNNIVR